MKVIHVPFRFRPDAMGGTEVYVEALAREQLLRGMEVVVAAPGQATTRQVESSLPVYRFAVSKSLATRSLYGEGDRRASVEFARLVEAEHPDIVHLHAFTSAVSQLLAQEVRKRGVPLVFTYHTPTVSCQRGTLLRWGKTECDGRLALGKCTSCALHGLGVNRWMSQILSTMPPAFGNSLGDLGLGGGPWTALRMTELMRLRHEAIRVLMNEADRIVVLCDWARQLLLRNGVPSHKLVLSRHGISSSMFEGSLRPARSGALRIAFLGRLHSTKGVDTLLLALRALPGVAMELDIFGIPDESDYGRKVKSLAARDGRVTLFPPVESDDIPNLLADYDVLAVPSRWLETGPLVVLEAFEAGIPVVGSRLGGIAELVSDGVDGLLVEADSVDAWRIALYRLATSPELLARLKSGVRQPRRMRAVADDMGSIYRDLVA